MPDTDVRDLTFTITAAQRLKIRDWMQSGHRCVPDSFMGLLTYSFTPCGIGDGVRVSCPCGQKLDLTDVDSW